MAECSKVTGKIIKCTEKGNFLGLMVENILESTTMTKNRDSVHFYGKNIAFDQKAYRPDGRKY